MFTRLGDAYRRIRNTLRILLGNLYDFPVAGVVDPGRPASSMPTTTLIDRWILHRLTGLIEDCRWAYDDFQFHKAYRELNEFCAVDLSSLYIDITKDRMYCDAPDSPRRRGTQAVMREILDALCRLLAPILVYTAEETWRYLETDGSIHLQEFPFPNPAYLDSRADDRMAEALQMRGVVYREIEKARRAKLIGNSLEAGVVYQVPIGHLIHPWQGRESLLELEEIMMVSSFRLEAGNTDAIRATVDRSHYKKCARCWRHRPTVGASKAHPDLCDRCESVVTRLGPHVERSRDIP
jgi:isoleucyl-tRNA synthetase